MVPSADEPTVDSAEAAWVGEVLEVISPELAALLREHVEDNYGQVLGTLFLGDVAKWFTQAQSGSVDQRKEVALALGREYETGGDYVQTVIVTGFLENLPFPGTAGREAVDLLPSTLRDALAQLEGGKSPASLGNSLREVRTKTSRKKRA